MKVIFLFLVSLLSVGFTGAQTPSIIKITQLKTRIDSGRDTIYVINFWATWCPPCVAEIHEIDSLGLIYSGTKVKFLLVSINYKEDYDSKYIPFIKMKNIACETVLLDENNFDHFPRVIDKEWNGDIPCTFVINNQKLRSVRLQKKITPGMLESEIQGSKK